MAAEFADTQVPHASGAPHHAYVEAALEAANLISGELATQIRAANQSAGRPPVEQSVYDLIVPVFNAPELLAKCIDSLLANTHSQHVIHLFDDASTDERIYPLLRRYASRGSNVRVYRLPVNLGFPGVVNAALASTTRDVVLINADTEYPPNWLGRMDRCRRSHSAIGAVSPLSNNATICSVPGFNQYNELPPGMSVPSMDALVEATSLRRFPPVPTAVGFCMLMTRAAIEEVGALDMAFGRGYGEETDWCQRAWAKGYASVICDDVYVYHHGGAAFGTVAGVDELKARNASIMAHRWPGYEPAVHAYCLSNPLRYQQNRIYQSLRHGLPDSGVSVLHVNHNFDQLAGTELFARVLIDGTRDHVASSILYPAPLASAHDATVELEGRGVLPGGLLKVRMNGALAPVTHSLNGASLSLRSMAVERFFGDILAASGAQIVHFNHLANFGSLALPLVAQAMGAKTVVTLHDYFLLCPEWNLVHAEGEACGEPRSSHDNPRCVQCLSGRIRAHHDSPPLDVVELLRARTALARTVVERADTLVAPSQFVRNQFIRAWGEELGLRINVIPNGTVPYRFEPAYHPSPKLRVAFVGNFTPLKGAETFAEAARRMADTSVNFVIIGAMSPGGATHLPRNVEVKGSYPPRELARLLQDIDVVYIGSIAPESYCYTLDEAYRAGAPVITTGMGAVGERVIEGKTGLLFRAGDAESLVRALSRLDGDRDLLFHMRTNLLGLRVRSASDTVQDYRAVYDDLRSRESAVSRAREALNTDGELVPAPEVSLQGYLDQRGLRVSLPLVPDRTGSPASRRAR